VVVKACAANVAERYQSAAEMAADLEFVKSGKSLLRVRKLERAVRRTLLISGAVVGAVVLAALIFGVFVFKNRATDQRVRSDLRQIQIVRTKNPHAGWFASGWSNLAKVAAVRADREVLEQASAMLAGFDTPLIKLHTDVGGSFGAFGPDGRAVIAGLGTNAAMLMDTNGDLTMLPVTGEGPVCWPDTDVPLQLAVVSSQVVLREALTGVVRRQFLQLDAAESSSYSRPLLALAPDGRNAAAAVNGNVLVWSAEAAESVGELPARATALTFSPDGSRLGVGEEDGTTRVFFVPGLTNEVVVVRATRTTPIRALAFVRDPLTPYDRRRDPNSWLLAIGDQSKAINIWDLQKRQSPIPCLGPIWQLTALAFHPDGLILASAGQATGKLLDARRGHPLLNFASSTGTIRFVTFDRTGQRMIWGAEPGAGSPYVGLRGLEFGRGITPLRGLRVAARKVWFSPDGKQLAALSDEWQVGIWDMRSRRLTALLETPVGEFADNAGAAFDASGKRFAFAGGSNACLFDLKTGATLLRWPLDKGYSDQVQFDSEGRLRLLRRERAAENRRWIWRLHELATSEQPALLHQQTNTNWSALGMTFLVDGKRFLVWHASNSETESFLRAYDVVTGQEIWRTATGRSDGDLRVCLDPTGKKFAHDALSGQPLRLFRLPDFQPIGLTAKGCIAIGPDGEQFLLSPWFLSGRPGDDGFPLWTDWESQSYVCAFSPNGSLVAWATVEGEVLVADLETVRCRLASLQK